MAKRKRNRRKERFQEEEMRRLDQQRVLDKFIATKTALFSHRRGVERRDRERSGRLLKLLDINGMFR